MMSVLRVRQYQCCCGGGDHDRKPGDRGAEIIGSLRTEALNRPAKGLCRKRLAVTIAKLTTMPRSISRAPITSMLRKILKGCLALEIPAQLEE